MDSCACAYVSQWLYGLLCLHLRFSVFIWTLVLALAFLGVYMDSCSCSCACACVTDCQALVISSHRSPSEVCTRLPAVRFCLEITLFGPKGAPGHEIRTRTAEG